MDHPIATSAGTPAAKLRVISLGNAVPIDDQNREVLVRNSIVVGTAITRIGHTSGT